MAKSTALWKPSSERDGNLVILFPYDAGEVVIRDAETGEVIATGRSTGPSNEFQDTIRFDRPGSSFNNVIVEDSTGRRINIRNGGNRHPDIEVGEPTGEVTDPGDGTPEIDDGGSSIPGGLGVAPPLLVDPSIIQANPIDFPVIPQSDFKFTDPIETTREVGTFNREQSARNFALGLERAGIIQEQELEDVIKFARGISEEQLKILDIENVFARQERLESAEAAIPGVQDIFKRRIERAETLAEGRFLDTAEDRAFELASRSAAAEGAVIQGFGGDSLLGQSASDLLSAKERLQVSQIGEGFLATSIQQASGILQDAPTKPNIAQRLPAQPSLSTAQLTLQQQAAETALTTIAPATALQANIQQEQFKTELNFETNKFNATGVFNASKFNSTQEFNAMLGRVGLAVGNIQAINDFNQDVINDIRGQEESDRLRERQDRAFAAFERNRDRKEFFENLGAIYGGIQNIPDSVVDFVREQFGDKAANALDFVRGREEKRPERDGGGRRPEVGGRDEEERPFEPDETGRDPQREADDEDPFEDDPLDEGPFPETPEEDLPPGTDPNRPAPEEDGVVDEDAATVKFLRNSRVNAAELGLSFARINSGSILDSGITLNLNIREDDEFLGMI